MTTNSTVRNPSMMHMAETHLFNPSIAKQTDTAAPPYVSLLKSGKNERKSSWNQGQRERERKSILWTPSSVPRSIDAFLECRSGCLCPESVTFRKGISWKSPSRPKVLKRTTEFGKKTTFLHDPSPILLSFVPRKGEESSLES